MSGTPVPCKTPGTALFPGCTQLPNLVHAELLGLSEEQLDWESHRWEWSRRSIRFLVSHMTSLIYQWLLGRWGSELFPEGVGLSPSDYQALLSVDYGPRLDERAFQTMEDIDRALRNAANLALQVLRGETARSLRERKVVLELGPTWEILQQAHPTGVSPAGEPGTWEITLEATFRHLYFECLAHLYDIQRLKVVQGEIAVCELPEEGYRLLPEWEQTEAKVLETG